MRLVAISALWLVATSGCDALFGLTHLKEQGSASGDDDDASVSDTPPGDAAGGRGDAVTSDAYVQKV